MAAPRRRLIVATRNEHKLRELGEILSAVELGALPETIELPPETGSSFAENALVKARTVQRATGEPAIGDEDLTPENFENVTRIDEFVTGKLNGQS